MVFGRDTTPDVLTTREVEECLNSNIAVLREGDEAWIITPYATMGALGPQRRALAEASKRGANISFVVRDEAAQVGPAERDMAEACANGLKLYKLHRLHAKLYWFENGDAIVTSANLVDGSFEASVEVGICVPGGALHAVLRDWIEGEIEPKLKRVGVDEGHCIRCGDSVEFNPSKPYCPSHYAIWAQFSNRDYEEKFCHKCGARGPSTMGRPLCPKCFAARRL